MKMKKKKREQKGLPSEKLTFLSLPVCLVMTLCCRSCIPTLKMREGAENVRRLAWLRAARTLPVADLSPVLLLLSAELAGSSAALLPVIRPGPGHTPPHSSSVLLWVGA